MMQPADKFDREFGFDDPMLAIHWTLWQTVVWIADRDPNSVREYTGPPWDIDRMRRKFWRKRIQISPRSGVRSKAGIS